jgi:hypothetical protein
MTQQAFSDRSRILTYQRCNRQRYLEYEWDGTGVRKMKMAVPLATGIYTHVGFAALLQGVFVDQAVKDALGAYDAEFARRGFDLEASEIALEVYHEQKAIVEGLLRVAAQRVIPALLDTYEVVEVERDDVWKDWAPGIDFSYRADALLREKASSELGILSLKTAAQWGARNDREATHDIQGLSEAVATENRLGEKVEFIKMIYLLKGRREQYPEDSGHWITWSNLIRGWRKVGITGDEFAWRYAWKGEDGVGHRLGKGWARFDAWDPEQYNGGVAGWIEQLAAGKVQPECGDPFESAVVTPMPYYRNSRDISDWLEQATAMETRVQQGLVAIQGLTGDALRSGLNVWFPQSRRNCDWPSKCAMQDICFADDSMLISPMTSGLYSRRVPHHSAEMEAVRGKLTDVEIATATVEEIS